MMWWEEKQVGWFLWAVVLALLIVFAAGILMGRVACAAEEVGVSMVVLVNSGDPDWMRIRSDVKLP